MLKYMTKYFDFDKEAITTLKKSSSSGEIPSTLEIKAKFTDETPDSHGDVITREATENALPDYREWRNIRYMHQPKAVGLAKNIGSGDGADLEWNEVVVKLVDRDTIHQVQEEVLKGLSVGILFNPFDGKSAELSETGNWIIHEYLLAEISVVDHPAHPNASVIEQSLGAVEDGRIEGFTPELKTAIRSATSTEELVPLLKSLMVEKEEDMEQEKLEKAVEQLEKEGRDWDKEKTRPEDVVEPVEIVDEEEEEEVVEEEAVEEEIVEEEVEPVIEEEAVEEEIEAEPVEEVSEVEEEIEAEKEVVEEVDEEELLELPEEELHIEDSMEEEEEVIEEEEEEEAEAESEEPLESNESEEFAITVNEDVNERLERIEASIEILLGEYYAEAEEAVEAEAEADTLGADEPEELELAESTQPSNRKSNMNMPADEEEEEETKKGFTHFQKRTDGQTRIRQTLDKFSI